MHDIKRLAILYNPNNHLNVSNFRAIQRFCQASQRFHVEPDIIHTSDLAHINHFDGLLVRDHITLFDQSYLLLAHAHELGKKTLPRKIDINLIESKCYPFEKHHVLPLQNQYEWSIMTLDREILAATQFYEDGMIEGVSLEKVPINVMDAVLNLLDQLLDGRGWYQFKLVEVSDEVKMTNLIANPILYAGIHDQVEQTIMYDKIIQYFFK